MLIDILTTGLGNQHDFRRVLPSQSHRYQMQIMLKLGQIIERLEQTMFIPLILQDYRLMAAWELVGINFNKIIGSIPLLPILERADF